MTTPRLVSIPAGEPPGCTPSSWEMLGRFGGLGHRVYCPSINMNPRVGAVRKHGQIMRRKYGTTWSTLEKPQTQDTNFQDTAYLIEGCMLSSLTLKEEQKITKLDSSYKYLNNRVSEDSFIGHFACDRRWRNDTLQPQWGDLGLKQHKESTAVPAIPHGIQGYKAKQIHRLALHKEPTTGASKPRGSDFCIEDDLNCMPAFFLPPTTSSQNEKYEILKHRSRTNNQSYSMTSFLSNQKSCTYTDPISGAPASFIQRLSEIASLECDTIRYEKNKKTKKNKRVDSGTL